MLQVQDYSKAPGRRPVRIAVISSKGDSHWYSCRLIRGNLRRSYLKLSHKFLIREFLLPRKNLVSIKTLKVQSGKVRSFDPDWVIFIDHYPHPYKFLNYLSRHLDKGVAFGFHLYGDFSIYTRQWAATETLLKGRKVHFFSASERHMKLVRACFQGASHSVVPFVVSHELFNFRSQLHKRRAERRAQSNQVSVLYCGRVTGEKNLATVIRIFQQPLRKKQLCLRIAGEDEVTFRQFFDKKAGKREIPELRRLARRLKIPSAQIKFLGSLSQIEVRRELIAADAFVSLSLYHDEDFGLAPAEALCSGTPCLLSDWGGYSSYRTGKSNIDPTFLPVRISRHGIQVYKTADAWDKLKGMAGESEKARRNRSSTFGKKYSLETVSNQLKRILRKRPRRFRGVTPLLRRHAEALHHAIIKGEPMFKLRRSSSRNLYRQYYRPYYARCPK